MRYYSLKYRNRNNSTDGPFQLDNTVFPRRSDGKPRFADVTHVRFNVPTVGSTCGLIRSLEEVGDCLHIWPYLVVSDRAREVFRSFRVPDDLRDVRASIFNLAGEHLGDFTWLEAARKYDCIDREKAELEYWEGSDHIRTVHRWVLDEARIPPLDLFLDDQRQFLVTEPLRRECYRRKLKNFKFLPVWDTERPLEETPR